MRDFKQEFENRVAWIRSIVQSAGCSGIIYGNSGGKDSALVGILCKAACDNTVGIVMPCASKRNFEEDMRDGIEVAEQFQIAYRVVDLTPVREALLTTAAAASDQLSDAAIANIAPRLRMTTLYAIGQTEGRLVAGTGNADELHVGYFTKYGDGGVDFNPIGDLTVGEIYAFLEWLNAPESIRTKAPSAGLFDGQTDESEMGILYDEIDEYLLTGNTNEAAKEKIERMHARSEHKRVGVRFYPN